MVVDVIRRRVVWEQPNKDKEMYLGLIGERVVLVIQRKGYEFYCCSTPQAIMGVYGDWDKDLTVLMRRAQVAFQKVGAVNHVLN